MAIQEAGIGKAIINEYPHKLEIVIPNKKTISTMLAGFRIIFGSIMAVVFESFLGRNGAGFSGDAFIWFWRASLCIFSLLGCRFLFFAFFGKEIWIFEGAYFTRIKKSLFRVSRNCLAIKKFEKVENLSFS